MEEIIFPNQIRMFRRVRGISMKKLADHLDLSLSAVSKIERGYRRIDEEQLKKLTALLDCPPESLFVTEESSQPEVIKAWREEQERRNKMNASGGLKTLGAGLRYLRGQKKLTLLNVAQGAGMTLSVYHRIEMGMREIEESVLERIAHALGYDCADLQVKIYELDMSGALDELKNNETKNGLETSKGGYNDLPVSRFMMKNADSQEVNLPILGVPEEDETINIDINKATGSILCPSTFSHEKDLYAVRLLTNTLGPYIPQRSIFVVAPHNPIQNGDIAILCVGDQRVKPVSVFTDKKGNWWYKTADVDEAVPVSEEEMAYLHRVIFVAMP